MKKLAPRKHKPQRVCSLSDFHTVKLMPCQSIVVVLKDVVEQYGDAYKNAEYEVRLNSDWLIIESVEKIKTDTIYTFSQYYNLEHERNNFCLGNIYVLLNTSKCNELKEKFSTICVFLENQNDIFTIINPNDEIVKIEPHNVLEVVVSEPSYNLQINSINKGKEDDWQFKLNNFYGDYRMVMIKKEIVVVDHDNPVDMNFPSYNRTFEINPWLSKHAKEIVCCQIENNQKCYREHHFWFTLDEDSLHKTKNAKNDSTPISNICFHGKCSYFMNANRSLDVVLNIRGKNRNRKHIIQVTSEKKDPTVRNYCDKNTILTNPALKDNIYFTPGYSRLMIEIAVPHTFDESLKDKLWDMRIENNNIQLNVVKLASAERWNTTFQRFTVNYNSQWSGMFDSNFIGRMVLSAEGLPNREIGFWFNPKLQENELPRRSLPLSHTPSEPVVTSYVNKHNYIKPKIAILEIEEIKFTELYEGTRTVYVKTTKPNYQVPIVPTPKKKSQTPKEYSETFKTYTNQTIQNEICASTVYYDPKDNYDIDMLPMTEAVLIIDNKFNVNIEDDSNIKMHIYQKNASGQNVKFRLHNLIPSGRRYYAGRVILESPDENRKIHFWVNATKRADEMKLDQSPHETIIEPIGSTENNFKFIKSFSHKNGVIINPFESLFINYPDFGDSWEDVRPQITVRQTSIPENVWNSTEIAKIKNNISRYSPWFQKFDSFIVANAINIRPIKQQQPYFDTIIAAMRDKFIRGRILVASIEFKCVLNKSNTTIESISGEVQNQTSIKRTLYVYINIDNSESKEYSPHYINNPPDQHRTSVVDGSRLIIKLPGMDIPWSLNSPSNDNVKFKTLRKEDNCFIFEFDVKNIVTDVTKVTFISGNASSRTLFFDVIKNVDI